MTSKLAWLHYLKKPFVLSMTMHLGILLLLVVFSQHFVPELPPVPNTLEAALVSRSSVNTLSNSPSASTPTTSSVPTPKPLPAVEEKPLTTPEPKNEIKEDKPIKNKVIEDKPKVEPVKKLEEEKIKKPKELKQETPEKTKEIVKKVEPPKKAEQPIKKAEIKKEVIKAEKTPPKKEKDAPTTPTKSELEKKSALIKAEKLAQAKAEKETKEKADKLAQAKAEKEAADKLEKEIQAKKELKDKADKLAKDKAEKEAKEKAEKLAQAKIEKEAKEKASKLAEAKAKIANLNKNTLDNEMAALKNAEKKEAQAKLLKAAQATSHNEDDRAFAEQQLADKKTAEKLAVENSNKELANLMEKYTRQIQKAIKQQWNKPPNTEKLSATVRITAFPDGEVRNIYITKSSGNDAFDASIKAAIDKASPLPVPKDNQALNEKFRLLTFNFGSED